MVLLELEARLDNLLATAQTEMANIDLYAPIAEREECPMCLIPLPIDVREAVFIYCCGKRICQGCSYKSIFSDMKKGVKLEEFKCAFCRQHIAIKHNDKIKELKRLMKKKIPEAFIKMAFNYKHGEGGVIQSDTKALEMFVCAAELGFADAFIKIGQHYNEGIVVDQDESKVLQYHEIAAKKGSLYAHQQLAEYHTSNGSMNLCIEHLKVAASAGDQESMDKLMAEYRNEALSKEVLTQTLRACQASQNGMKSKDREDARAYKARHKA